MCILWDPQEYARVSQSPLWVSCALHLFKIVPGFLLAPESTVTLGNSDISLSQLFATNWYYFQHKPSPWVFWKALNQVSPSSRSDASSFLGYQVIWREKEGNGSSLEIKCYRSRLITKVREFFLNKCPSICCIPLVNFQSTEKVVFDQFASFITDFWEDLPRSSLLHFPLLSSLLLIMLW